jgi:hypothetical protein
MVCIVFETVFYCEIIERIHMRIHAVVLRSV